MSLDANPASSVSTVDALIQSFKKNLLPALISGLGGMLAILPLAELTVGFHYALLIAPFGASCVLLFALPQSPLARPRNVIGGHFVSSLVGLLMLHFIGDGVIEMAVGVGIAIAAMQLTGTVHPPAGGDPLIVILIGAGWSFLAMPILVGTSCLVIVALLYHRFFSKRVYPAP